MLTLLALAPQVPQFQESGPSSLTLAPVLLGLLLLLFGALLAFAPSPSQVAAADARHGTVADAQPGERVALQGMLTADTVLDSPLTGRTWVFSETTFFTVEVVTLGHAGGAFELTGSPRGRRRRVVVESGPTADWAQGLRLHDGTGEVWIDPTDFERDLSMRVRVTHRKDPEEWRRLAPKNAEAMEERGVPPEYPATVVGVIEARGPHRWLVGGRAGLISDRPLSAVKSGPGGSAVAGVALMLLGLALAGAAFLP